MHKLATLLLPLALALPVTAAEDRFDPEARAKAIAPFVDAQTIAVAHIDVMRVDLEGLVTALTDIAHLETEEVMPFKQAAQQWIADFKQAGGKEAYVTASLDDLPQHLSLIVPIENDANARAIQELLRSQKSTELAQYMPLPFGIEIIERVDGAIFAGSKSALARLHARKPAPRPEVAKAFAAAGDTVAQLLLLPTADLRRVIEEIIPALPAAVGDGPSTTFTHGFLWAALGLDGPPKVSLRLVIQSQDAAAAKSFAVLLANVSKALGQDKELRRLVPNLDKILRLLPPLVKGDRLTLTLEPADRETTHLLAALTALVTQPIRRDRCAQNLRQIGLALHTYLDVHGQFPPQANHDAQGKALLSWRVHILPYLGEEKLFKEFHLKEPWDSEHNKQLIARMPAVYHCPSLKRSLKNQTTYLGPVYESAMFTSASEGLSIKDVTDGTSNTIFVVDANDDHAVIWTKPEDLKLDPNHPQKGLVGHHDDLIVALFVDGAVRFLPDTLDAKTLLGYFTRNGGEVSP